MLVAAERYGANVVGSGHWQPTTPKNANFGGMAPLMTLNASSMANPARIEVGDISIADVRNASELAEDASDFRWHFRGAIYIGLDRHRLFGALNEIKEVWPDYFGFFFVLCIGFMRWR